MKKLWNNKKYRYSGIAVIVLVAISLFVFLRPKPIANYKTFANNYNESSLSDYTKLNPNINGKKRVKQGIDGYISVDVKHGELISVETIDNPVRREGKYNYSVSDYSYNICNLVLSALKIKETDSIQKFFMKSALEKENTEITETYKDYKITIAYKKDSNGRFFYMKIVHK